MPSLVFFNNAESTLNAPLAEIGDDFSAVSMYLVAGTGAQFGAPTEDRRLRLTLTHPDTPGAHEIVEARSRSGDMLSVYRGLEGTQVRAWSAGAKVSNYLTAGAVNRFVLGASNEYENMQGGYAVGATAFLDTASLPKPDGTSDFVTPGAGQLLGLPSGGSHSLGVILKSGKASGQSSGDVNSLWGAARVVRVAASYNATGMALGTVVAGGEGGVALGAKAAAGEGSVSVGSSVTAVRQGVALGRESAALGERSLAVGAGALALGDSSIALGDGAYQAADRSISFGALPTIPRVWRALDGNSENAWEHAGAEGVIASRFYDLGVSPQFSGGTVVDGDVYQPSAGAVRYRAFIPYDPRATANSFNAPAVTLPPSGMMNQAMDSANSNEATWVAHEGGAGLRVILSLPLHVLFFPTEVGFILFKSTSSAAPAVSVGDMGSDTAVLPATALPGPLTGKAIHRLPITAGKGVEGQLRFTLATAADGQFLGRFYAKGLFINTQG